jgi:hypothetical protein
VRAAGNDPRPLGACEEGRLIGMRDRREEIRHRVDMSMRSGDLGPDTPLFWRLIGFALPTLLILGTLIWKIYGS